MITTTRTRTLLATGALAALLATGACSSGDGSDHGAQPEPAVAERGDAAMPDDAAGGDALRDEAQAEAGSAAEAPDEAQQIQEPREPAIISTGTVSLESEDVAGARFDVQKIVDAQGGSISQQETTTGDDGDLETARIVLRIPSESFADAFAALEDVATLTGSTTGSEDVTTEVIDVEARIRAQEKSVARIETLLAEADSIRQIMAVESELSRRQAELDSLTSQQEWLRDQTSLATLTVHVERADGTDEDDTGDAGGFLSGLQGGWGALVTGLSVALTGLGYALPWLLALAVVGAPLWLWLRSGRRRRTTPATDTGAQP
jgi:hypothetical protein